MTPEETEKEILRTETFLRLVWAIFGEKAGGASIREQAENMSHEARLVLIDDIEDVISKCAERDEAVLWDQYKLGEKFDATRERIRQIEAAALRKLRYPGRSKKLKSFIKG